MKKALLILLYYVAAQIVTSAVFLLALNARNIFVLHLPIDYSLLTTRPVWMGMSLLVSAVVGIWIVWQLKLIRRRPIPPRPARTPLRYGWMAVVGALLVSMGCSSLLEQLHLADGGTTSLFRSMAGNPLCLITLCLIGPLAEEIIFREGILRRLAESGTASWAAIVASSVFFSMFHGNLAQGLPAFVLGALFGLLYVGTGDVRLPLISHVLNNILGLVLMISEHLLPMRWLDAHPSAEVAMGAVFLAGGVGLVVLWWRKRAPYSFLAACRTSPDYL